MFRSAVAGHVVLTLSLSLLPSLVAYALVSARCWSYRYQSEVQQLRNVSRTAVAEYVALTLSLSLLPSVVAYALMSVSFGSYRYQSEVQRLRNVFRSAVAGDVARLREAVGEYKENTSRLECQKQLLLKQVCVLITQGTLLTLAVE